MDKAARRGRATRLASTQACPGGGPATTCHAVHARQNVHAAQWSPNGGALGQADLTQPGANVFGENVFSTAVQRQRLPKAVYKQLQETLDDGRGRSTPRSPTPSPPP